MVLALMVLPACAPRPLEVEVVVGDAGFEVVADRALRRVEVTDAAGDPVVARRGAGERLFLAAPVVPGAAYRVAVDDGNERVDLVARAPDAGPLRVELEAPAGQGRRSVGPGSELGVWLVGDGPAEDGPAEDGPAEDGSAEDGSAEDGSAGAGAVRAQVVLTAREPIEARVRLGEVEQVVRLEAAGATAAVSVDVARPGIVPLEVQVEGEAPLRAAVRAERLPIEEARALLTVVAVHLPADAAGDPQRARPADRVTLPAAWWRALLRGAGLGYRARDDQVPWCWETVTLENTGNEALNVVVRAGVRDASGREVPAFRARLREQDDPGGAVRALLRVPPGERATAALPLYVDGSALPADAVFERWIEVVPLGSRQPLHALSRPLVVSRGSAWASAGFLVAVLTSALGLGGLAWWGPRGLARARTSELVTVAMFGSVTFVVGAAFQVLGTGVAALLGPFAPLLTGIADDAFRACLLGTLVALLPRPGVLALATVLGFLLRGLALGSFHPVDLLYVGAAVFWLETLAWSTGLTRGRAWWDEASRTRRWLRLSAGLALANVAATATGLVVSVVLYRLFLASWYVALLLLLPGFAYVVLGCWIAVDFAAALRRVEA